MSVAVEKEIADIVSPERRNENSRAEAMIARVRKLQNDPRWLEELRRQYTPEVARRTVELNEQLDEEFARLESEYLRRNGKK